ncbi:hypothetical protein FZC35_00010 [Candidatus Cytomitobacter indipagum]|uniref:Type II secretion system protein GspF domain-containing protein n=1 Tax=Candidatus Cytomitobacter indipagum TaxID=2601575 RepID=A0A5C0UDS3_9PROT|nr:type II secretion system F family protein [Candidatus Cytomitobacter indipagum]QEK37783.1 hypothetical protein FZC35_00010 [Candidatus Cytomitobacter indipagum]
MLFKYLALSKSGVRKSGLLEANSFEDAMMVMDHKDMSVVSLKRKIVFFGNKLSDSDLFLMFDFLSKFMLNGLALDKSLDMIYECSIRSSSMCINIKLLIVKGFSFSEALLKNKKQFNKSNIGIFSVIDKVGSINKFCVFLSQYYKKMHKHRNKIKKNMRYPILLCVFFLISFSVVLNLLIPSIVDLMQQTNQDIPAPLSIMNHISSHFGLYVLSFASLPFLAFIFRERMSDLLDIIPFVRKYRMYRDFSFFFYVSSMLLSNEIRLINGFRIAKDCMLVRRNAYMIEEVCSSVESGESISNAFQNAGIEERLCKLIDLYEKSANLQDGFHVISEMYEMEMFKIIDGIGDYLQPVILSLITGLISLIVYSIMVPVYSSFSV